MTGESLPRSIVAYKDGKKEKGAYKFCDDDLWPSCATETETECVRMKEKRREEKKEKKENHCCTIAVIVALYFILPPISLFCFHSIPFLSSRFVVSCYFTILAQQ